MYGFCHDSDANERVGSFSASAHAKEKVTSSNVSIERRSTTQRSARDCFTCRCSTHVRVSFVRSSKGLLSTRVGCWSPCGRFFRVLRWSRLRSAAEASASDVWCQIFADVLNMRVRQIASPLQANVLGSAFIAGIGAMTFDDVVPSRTRLGHTDEPTPAHRPVHDTACVTFQDFYKRLSPNGRRINQSTKGRIA